jgi:hypothetical protein
MDLAGTHGLTAELTKESTKMIKKKDSEFTLGKMEKCIVDNGGKEFNMD